MMEIELISEGKFNTIIKLFPDIWRHSGRGKMANSR